MSALEASAAIPYLRSCQRETGEPVHGAVKGEIPKWLKGSLIRIGSGLLQVGPDRFNHVFDGMALMHAFRIDGGGATYRSRFLRSDTYRKNMAARRIVVSEFATSAAAPDPCKTIFQRFRSLFSLTDFTDNDLVNVVCQSGETYACAETSRIWRIDPDDLRTVQKVDLADFVPVITATAHPHRAADGALYNVGSSAGSYNVVRFPPRTDQGAFRGGAVVCRIPQSSRLSPSYYHSFGMTERHLVLVEQPLFLSVPRMVWARWVAGAYADALYWDSGVKTKFHVVRRSDGSLLDTTYVAEAFFVFHHINAFEQQGHLVVDLCCFDDGGVVRSLYVEALQELFQGRRADSALLQSTARRYVLPLDNLDAKPGGGGDLVSIAGCLAKASVQGDGSVLCEPEILTGTEPWSPELPRINYEGFNGKKYKFFYGIARYEKSEKTHLVKVNTVEHSTIAWSETDAVPSEPVFIADPGSQENDEDGGVVVASLLYTKDERKVSLLVLEAKTMKEIARVDFFTESSVPGDFHGTFIPNV